jgi:ABC-type sugar transport system substrate-binding protein
MVARRVDAGDLTQPTNARWLLHCSARSSAGIPVTVFDSAVKIDGYVSFIATDNYRAGCLAARKLTDLIGGHGSVRW